MIVSMKTLGMLGLALTLTVAWGCSRRPSRVYPPSINASAAGEAAMAQYDTNKDGKVAAEELAAAPSLREAIDNLDTDGDKAVSGEEVTARILKWQESKLGRTSLSCHITYGGRSLADAKVALEPEAFLGENMKAAEGTTDQRGAVSLTIPGDKDPGVAPGLYKVKITSDKVRIPAKYNEQTTLGIEVANDAKMMEGAVEFKL